MVNDYTLFFLNNNNVIRTAHLKFASDKEQLRSTKLKLETEKEYSYLKAQSFLFLLIICFSIFLLFSFFFSVSNSSLILTTPNVFKSTGPRQTSTVWNRNSDWRKKDKLTERKLLIIAYSKTKYNDYHNWCINLSKSVNKIKDKS